ncbi:DUF3221 domain-containing protein [Paenibacillus sacheonensis]|uniref:DUF3221 domain-containing protein n=1 Tax=Paenibacillus sacheonensis TaxID=742054 RepID=A0A7X4YTU4_9BACL|nr:DUF3221 domain-containing protein [Paenibacillus sacheonensis]MBM7568583.1 hypothetical protein [Paenibacillus sacheonensis]NBC72403.1 DUF3221 domain-containing protein [Paenibacillus sacheonensis]
MKKAALGIVTFLLFVVLNGCRISPEAGTGDYIIAKDEQRILVAKNISRADAANQTLADLREKHVEVIAYILEDAGLYDELEVGNRVKVTPKTTDKGEYIVMQSDPPQIVAGKVVRQ